MGRFAQQGKPHAKHNGNADTNNETDTFSDIILIYILSENPGDEPLDYCIVLYL